MTEIIYADSYDKFPRQCAPRFLQEGEDPFSVGVAVGRKTHDTPNSDISMVVNLERSDDMEVADLAYRVRNHKDFQRAAVLGYLRAQTDLREGENR